MVWKQWHESKSWQVSKVCQQNGSFVVNVGENKISETITDKLLGVTFGNRLTFNNHVSKLCKTISNKPYGLTRVAFYTDQDKKILLFIHIFIAIWLLTSYMDEQ